MSITNFGKKEATKNRVGKTFLKKNITELDITQPIEERDYKDFFNDLDIDQKLQIKKTNEETNTQSEEQQQHLIKKQELVKKELISYLKETDLMKGNTTEINIHAEYDMDEQDNEFIKRAFKDLEFEHKELLFEFVFDKIEKHRVEYSDCDKTNSTKRKTDKKQKRETKCSICEEGSSTADNNIVQCHICRIGLHQECYGIPYKPEGQWLCRKCLMESKNKTKIECMLCPNKEMGGFKQTIELKWTHLLCAIYIKELTIENIALMEPVIGMDNIHKQRWKLKCYLCKLINVGCCIQCCYKACKISFHVTCAKAAGFKMEKKFDCNVGFYDCKAYCFKHSFEQKPTPTNDLLQIQKNIRTKLSTPSSNTELLDNYYVLPNALYSKVLGQTKKTFSTIVPQSVNSFMQNYVSVVCKYWCLKKKGLANDSPLFNSYSVSDDSPNPNNHRKHHNIYNQVYLKTRTNLEKARVIVDLVKKREKLKLSLLYLYKKAALLQPGEKTNKQNSMYYYKIILESVRHLLNKHKLSNSDNKITKRDISLLAIEHKIDAIQYFSFDALKKDLYLFCFRYLLNPNNNPSDVDSFMLSIKAIFKIVNQL